MHKMTDMPAAAEALPGRDEKLPVLERHFVNGNTLQAPFPDGMQLAMFGLGCFWGAEVEGLSGFVSAPRHKFAAPAVLLISFASLGVCTAELLEMLCGRLAYVFCFRRPLMAVLSHVCRQSGEG